MIGADRIVDGDPLYGEGFSGDVERGDTYGPGHLPAVRAVRAGDAVERPLGRPARRARRRDRLRPAHARRPAPARPAAAAGAGGARARRSAGLRVGRLSLHAFALQTNSNDSLVALLTWRALLAADARARLRGRALDAASRSALAAAAKFAPLALAPLFATRAQPRRVRRALAAVLVAAVAPVRARRRAARAL